MPLSFLLDENLRGRLWFAIRNHNVRGMDPLDAVRVGDFIDLPLGSPDPAILLWAEREGRLLISLDEHTMPFFLANHLKAGRHSPGVLLVRDGFTLSEIVDHLVLVAYASNASEWEDQAKFIP